MNARRYFPLSLPLLLGLLCACAPAARVRLELSQDAEVEAELERFIAFNRLEASAIKIKADEYAIVFTRELPSLPSLPFIALQDFIDFTAPADPPALTLEITEKEADVIRVLDLEGKPLVYRCALDTDGGDFSSYGYEMMGSRMEDRTWDVPLDQDLPELRYTAEMRAGDPDAFTDEAARAAFDKVMQSLSGIPRTAEHRLTFGPSNLDPGLTDLSAEFNAPRVLSFTFTREEVDQPTGLFDDDESGPAKDTAADIAALQLKSSKTFKLIILFPKLATYLKSYSFSPK